MGEESAGFALHVFLRRQECRRSLARSDRHDRSDSDTNYGHFFKHTLGRSPE